MLRPRTPTVTQSFTFATPMSFTRVTCFLSMADDETVIIAGHGRLVSNKQDLETAIDMLEDGSARVKALVDQGMSQNEVLASNPLASYHDDWSWSFITTERMTTTLYRSLTSDN